MSDEVMRVKELKVVSFDLEIDASLGIVSLKSYVTMALESSW